VSVLLVCGGRNYRNSDRVWQALDAIQPRVIVHGGAQGADNLAGAWAAERGILCVVIPALWAAHGTAGGPIRNRRMLKVARALVDNEDFGVMAFPGGRGTEGMISIAEKHGVAVARIGGGPWPH